MEQKILNICYEYSEDVMFSQNHDENGSPCKLIIYTQNKFIKELSSFLKNYNYKIYSIKKMGSFYSLINFNLTDSINCFHHEHIEEDI